MSSFTRMIMLLDVSLLKGEDRTLKLLKIPWLELHSIVLLTILLCFLSTCYNIQKAKAFCDSLITLACIKRLSTIYQTFVLNCVEFLISVLFYKQWYYVKTVINLADLLTCSILIGFLINDSLCLNVPEWLKKFGCTILFLILK